MSEKTIYRFSDVLANHRGGKAARLALIHFVEMTEEEQRSELEAVRSLPAIEPDRKQTIVEYLEDVIAATPGNRRRLVSQLREDFRNDLLAGLV